MPGLLERDGELEALRACATAREGRAIAIEGPAGIGKSALLEAARGAAEAAGLKTLTARGTELERAFAFGVVRQLLEPVVAPEHFEGASQAAAAVLDCHGVEPAPLPLGPEGAYLVLHGLYRLVAKLAPIALLVDDAHWADGASLRFLAYLGNRLSQVPVVLVVAARPPGEPGGAAVAIGPDATVLNPRTLSDDASARVVRAAIPHADASVCRACHDLTGGNPFFLGELARALRDDGPKVLDVAPTGVVASVHARMARFPRSAQRLAAAASIVGDGALIRHAAALAELDDRPAAKAADALLAGGILAATHPLRFLHPIIRTAVHEQLTPAVRSTGHERAARLLAEEDAAPERVAAHLLATEPRGSEWGCERLRAAARSAMPRGAPDASVAYLRRALEEPPAPGERPTVLLELGIAESLTLDRAPAIEHLRRGVRTTTDTVARLYAARTLAAMVGMESPSEAVAIGERALAASPDADPDLVLMIEAHMLAMARFSLSARATTYERAKRMRSRVEAGELDGPMELTVAATEVTMAGESAERAADLARRAIAALRADPIVAVVVGFAARCLTVADRIEEAERILTATIDEARRQQANYRLGPLLGFRSDAHFRAGALDAAAADGEAALRGYGHAGRLSVLGAVSVLVQAQAERGEFDAAEAALAEGGEPGDAYTGTLALHARARLRLAQGNVHAGLADALEVGRRQAAMREPNPAAAEWRTHAALAAAALGRHDEAVTLAREEFELARRFGAPRAVGIALRTLGVVDENLEALRTAVDVLAGTAARLEHARALTELGVALRHRRQIVEAREPLRAALDLANRCGARPLAERAKAELLIAGARPRRSQLSGVDALTTNERRVASLAADGHSNREIAHALYVSHKTVEKHLSAAYRKLGIATRTALAEALAAKE